MWSSQHYITLGDELGSSRELLERAVAQIESVIDPSPHPPALLTLRHLVLRAEVPHASLRRFVAHDPEAYRSFAVRKRSGGVRIIHVPEPQLLKAQRWLAQYVLNRVPVHQRSFAFAPEASIVNCAAKHCGSQWLIKLDVRGFFGSISELQIHRIFRSLNYQPLIAFELARLCTFAPASSPRYQRKNWRNWKEYKIEAYSHRGQGYLPQGAPTSPMLSNLAMRELDEILMQIGLRYGLYYSRYSDDMTFSTRSTKFSRSRAKDLILEVRNSITAAGLRLNGGKTTIVPPGSRKVVLGLLVDGGEPALSREFRSLLRQHLHYLEKFGPIAHAQVRNFDTVSGMRRHIRGLIDFANMVDRSYASPLLDRFKKIAWP
jgi:RNA-directed DNA polymerase